uniref:Putative transglycosylase n=1 Tax=viral metagenome TaxID=1070528 RepID=A0A6H1ZCE0_9ZZZZ
MKTVQDMIKQVESENLSNVAARSVADPNKLITGGTVGSTQANGMIAPTAIKNQAITTNKNVDSYTPEAVTKPTPIAPAPAQTSRYYDESAKTWKDGSKPTATTAPRYDASGNLAGGTRSDGSTMSLEEWKAQQNAGVDENAIREQVRSENQARIDAINGAYDSMIGERRVVNEGNLGKTRAVNARSGLIGSDFGDANTKNQENANANALKAIEVERGQQISAIYTKMDEVSYNRIQAEKAQASNDADGYANYIAKAQEAASATIETLGTAGYSIDDIKADDPERLQQLLESTNMSELELAAKLNMYKPAEEKIDWKTDIKGNYLMAYGIDPKTGEMKYYTQELPADAVGNDVKIVDGELWSVTPDGLSATKIGGSTKGDYQFISGNDNTQAGVFDKNTGTFEPKAGKFGAGVENPWGDSYDGGTTSSDSPYTSGVDEFDRLVDGIANMESGFNYGAVSQASANGDRAYGKYQIMGNNIPSWSKAVLGQSMTAQEFLKNPEAQEIIARKKLAEYYQKYGTVEDTASMWFSGRPAAGNNSADVYGTTVPAYIKNITSYVRGGGATKSNMPVVKSAGSNDNMPVTKVTGNDNMPTSLKPGLKEADVAEAVTTRIGTSGDLGEDGFLSPDDYQKYRNMWTQAGYSATSFDTKMKGYRNPNNPDYAVNKKSTTSSSGASTWQDILNEPEE